MSARTTGRRTLASLGLPQPLQNALTAAKFVFVDDLRGISPVALAMELKVSNQDALSVLKATEDASTSILAMSTTLTKPPKEFPRISTGSRSIDLALGGGITVGEVMEFCGPPGMGKTQLGIQLAVHTQIPADLGGLAGKSVYVDTEGSFTAMRAEDMSRGLIDRLRNNANKPAPVSSCATPGSQANSSLTQSQLETIAKNRAAAIKKRKISAEKTQQLVESATATLTAENMLDNIFVYRVYDCSEQLAVGHILPQFLEKHPDIRLVVIDSVAFHFRHDYEEFAQRARLLTSYAQSLAILARKYDVAVVLMNQVTTKMDDQSEGSRDATLVPALGNSWAHACTTRCMLYWDCGTRVARLIKSPNRPDVTVQYAITADGVRDYSA